MALKATWSSGSTKYQLCDPEDSYTALVTESQQLQNGDNNNNNNTNLMGSFQGLHEAKHVKHFKCQAFTKYYVGLLLFRKRHAFSYQ